MLKNKMPTYNDGVVSIVNEKEEFTTFNAKKTSKKKSDFEEVVKLQYKKSSRRSQDMDFAEKSGFSLSLKICTRLFKDVSCKQKAIIENTVYNIAEIDESDREMFLYLERGRDLDG